MPGCDARTCKRTAASLSALYKLCAFCQVARAFEDDAGSAELAAFSGIVARGRFFAAT